MTPALRAQKLQLVVKVTKQCNLRCSYCYEFPYLSQKGVVALENIERMFDHFASYQFDAQTPLAGDEGFEFIWHGGEPFMVPIEHYEAIGALEKSTFEPLGYNNVIQTNLTILTDKHLDWLERERFVKRGGLGFSFDVYGDQRRDIRGLQTTQKVLQNLKRLIDNEIPVGGIAVLSQSTLTQVEGIFRFFSDLDIAFRLLPYHLETQPKQTEVNGVSPEDIAAAMCKLFDLWRQSEEPITIAPLQDYLADAIGFLNGRNNAFYDKTVDESIFVIDTDGDVYGHETYLQKHRYGNIFMQSFEEILASSARRDLIAKAGERVETYCAGCEFYGACSGYPVAEANPMEERWIASRGCYVAKVLAHIVEQLDQAGLGRLPSTDVSNASSGVAL
jgi:uncharacterized protein